MSSTKFPFYWCFTNGAGIATIAVLPGMMDAVLNLGMTPAVQEALAAAVGDGSPTTAAPP